MNAEVAIPVESPGRAGGGASPSCSAATSGCGRPSSPSSLALLAVVAVSYLIVTRTGSPEAPLTPETVAALLVANLVPAIALMVMVARRLAIRRTARSDIGGKARLHVRLVALFSIIAAVPTLLVVIFASMLFQSGVKFWFSDQAQTVLRSAENVSQIYQSEHSDRLRLDVQVMGADVVDRINRFGSESQAFRDDFLYQTAARQLTETAVLTMDRGRPGAAARSRSISTTARSPAASAPRCCARCAPARCASSSAATGSRRWSGSIRRRRSISTARAS